MDLQTKYMNIDLRNPLIASSSPFGGDTDQIRKLEQAGIAAVILPSLFEEQVQHEADELDYFLHYGANRFAESLTYYPEIEDFKLDAEQYIDHLADAVQAVNIPIIGSLNGVSARGWTSYAKRMEDAGAAGVELNIYFLPTNPEIDSESVEQVYIDAMTAVKDAVDIPVSIKLSPYITAPAAMIDALAKAGADGVAMFNRFYQPDIDVENLEVSPSLVLSRASENRLPMRWIAILYGRIKTSLAATTGIHTGVDIAKMVLAGADAAMICSALLLNGPKHAGVMLREFEEIMKDKEYESVEQMKGVLSLQHVPEPAAFERANYMKTLSSYGRTATLE